jgi:hypothetical protein
MLHWCCLAEGSDMLVKLLFVVLSLQLGAGNQYGVSFP